jgi:hypothetical protein
MSGKRVKTSILMGALASQVEQAVGDVDHQVRAAASRSVTKRRGISPPDRGRGGRWPDWPRPR